MNSSDLTPAQAERLFAVVSRNLEYQHRLLARMRAAGFPEEDDMHRGCRNSVEEMRNVYLIINELRARGLQWQALQTSKHWAPL